MLGDSLRSLLLSRTHEEWDLILSLIMRACHSTSYSSTLETPNFLMLGRETRVPKHLTYYVPALESSVHEYVDELITRTKMAHEILHDQQWRVRSEDSDDHPLYKKGDWV